MSFHHDPEKWLFQAQKENCPYCRKDEDLMQTSTLEKAANCLGMM